MTALSPDVIDFASTYLSSLEDLQVLTMCVDHPERWWDAVLVARYLRISRSAARRALDRLARANLLDIRITGDVRYQFKPGMLALEHAAQACVAAFHTSPAEVAEFIGNQRRRGV